MSFTGASIFVVFKEKNQGEMNKVIKKQDKHVVPAASMAYLLNIFLLIQTKGFAILTTHGQGFLLRLVRFEMVF